jgi:hypothetical protein
MKKTVLYVGIDVDDKAFHGAGYEMDKQRYFEFKCKPTFGKTVGTSLNNSITHFR